MQIVFIIGDWGNEHVNPPKNLIIRVLESILKGASLDRSLDLRSSLYSVHGIYLLVITCNIFDFFTGYSIQVNIMNKKVVLYKSNYLLGIDVSEISLEFVSSGKILLRDIIVEFSN